MVRGTKTSVIRSDICTHFGVYLHSKMRCRIIIYCFPSQLFMTLSRYAVIDEITLLWSVSGFENRWSVDANLEVKNKLYHLFWSFKTAPNMCVELYVRRLRLGNITTWKNVGSTMCTPERHEKRFSSSSSKWFLNNPCVISYQNTHNEILARSNQEQMYQRF